MACCGPSIELINPEYQELLGRCWYFSSSAIDSLDEVTAEVDYWGPGGKKGEGSRPLAMFLLDSASHPPTHNSVAVNKPRKLIALYEGVTSKPLSQFDMQGVSDDKIAHLSMSGVKVGFALGFTSAGIELGLDRRDEHSKGTHQARFVVAVQLYTISINLQTIEKKAGWSRAISNEQITADEFDTTKYGRGVVSSVTFGGLMMLELDQENYEEMRKSFGGNVKLSGGLDGIEAQLGVYHNNETGKQRFSCRVKTNGGRKPDKDMINIDAAGLLKMIREYVKKLEQNPHEAVPLRLAVTSFESFLPSQYRFVVPPASPEVLIKQLSACCAAGDSHTNGIDDSTVDVAANEDGSNDAGEQVMARIDSAHPAEVEALAPAPAEPSPPVVDVSVEVSVASASKEPRSTAPKAATPHHHTPTGSPAAASAPRQLKDVVAAMKVASAIAATTQPDANGLTAADRRARARTQMEGANYVFAADAFLPNGGDALVQGLLLEKLRAAQTSAGKSEEHALELYGCDDWLSCTVAVMTRPNGVYHLDLHEVDMQDWQAVVLAGVLEGSAHTDKLQVVTLAGNFDVQEAGAVAVVKALEAVGERRALTGGGRGPLQLYMNGVAQSVTQRKCFEGLQSHAKHVRVEV